MIIISILITYLLNIDIKLKNIKLKDNKYIITLNYDDVECILSNTTPTSSSDWTKSEKNICTIDYKEGIYNLYIKNNDEIINLTNNDIIYINTSNEKEFYIANNSKEKYFKSIIGNIDLLDIKSEDNNIAYINNEGYIETKEYGETTLTYTYKLEKYILNVTSTNLIVEKPEEFDFNKDFLSCNEFNDEEAELLDTILKKRINNVGYKTRAGVVEAARFLTLEFPYKISYFYENGRITTNKIDGEGRYYHIGLYLSENKFSNILKSTNNPSIWGCSLYSNPIKSYSENGLDCSGFVSWAILNGGFDIEDVGAGFRSGESNDLTDYGEIKTLSNKVLKENEIKPGDLLHSEDSGGHIAMIIGIKDEYYYVAQALWKYAPSTLSNTNDTDNSVQITKYTKKELINAFNEIILMDEYYKEDGNLTSMWY